jgi:hypothetical protein
MATTFLQAIQEVFAGSSLADTFAPTGGLWAMLEPEVDKQGNQIVLDLSSPLIVVEHKGETPAAGLPGSGRTLGVGFDTRELKVTFHVHSTSSDQLDQQLIPALKALYNPKSTSGADPLSIAGVQKFGSLWTGTRQFADVSRGPNGQVVYVGEVDYTFRATFQVEGD